MSFLLYARDYELGYGKKQILVPRLNFQLGEGEWMAVMGTNGSGKTTLLRHILGLLPQRNGLLTVLGETPQKGNPSIGYLSQLREINPNLKLTGEELVKAAAQGWRLGLPFLSKNQKKRVNECLEEVDGLSFASLPFHTLSGGQKQRLRLAQALLDEPRLLLLDEPFTHLDPAHQQQLILLLDNLRKKKSLGILLVTHQGLQEMMPYLSGLLYLSGEKTHAGTVHDATFHSLLEKKYHVA